MLEKKRSAMVEPLTVEFHLINIVHEPVGVSVRDSEHSRSIVFLSKKGLCI